MSLPSSNVSRLLSFGVVAVAAAGAVIACGGSTSDANDPEPDSGIVLPVDAGHAPDAAAPTDASTPVDASTPTDASVPVDAGVITASYAADFSTTANPSGAWTFGYSLGIPGGDASAMIVYADKNNPVTDVTCWYDHNDVSLGAPAACLNAGATATSTGVEPGEAALHPGEHGEYSIARWTAAKAGSYVVHVQFKAGDSGETNGLVVKNDTVLFTADATSTNPTDDRTVALAAGDTIGVAVGSLGNFLNDTTPVTFTIHSAP